MLPVRSDKKGKRTALSNAPIAPIIFMAPDNVPVCLPPMSAQAVQLGLKVRSTPNVAMEKHRMKLFADGMEAAARTLAAATPNPHMAGSLRDSLQCPRR